MEEKLLEYINKALKRGYSKEQIVNALARAGHEITVIEQHFEHLKKRNIIKVSIALCLAAIITAILIAYVYKSKSSIFVYPPSDIFEDEDFFSKEYANISQAELKGLNKSLKSKFDEAKSHYIQKDLDRALEEFDELVKSKPNKPVFHFYLGGIYCKRGEYQLAVSHYKKAISLNDRKPSYYISMARCLERQGLHDKAMEVMNKALYVNLNSTSLGE